jgi:hypothetical protein
MAKSKKPLHPDAPLYHLNHSRPVTRRDFLRQGFISGTGVLVGSSLFGMLASTRPAHAGKPELEALATAIGCSLGISNVDKIPFICFDLAGGANIAGSNVLVGGQGGQFDFLSTAGYNKLGLPGDMLPGQTEATPTATGNGDHTDTSYGLAFHTDSAMLRGIQQKAGTRGPLTNGAVIPARSENDTGDNPHNPMYGIAKAAASLDNTGKLVYPGSVVTLIGSRNSDSGGNSLAPDMLMIPEIRPTKVDRPSDVTGMVDVGNLASTLPPADLAAVMEYAARISDRKLARVNTGLSTDQTIKDLVECGYLKSAYIAADPPAGADPATDPDIVGATGIFTQAEFNGDDEFRKAASIMKMVVEGYAHAGTVTMGGYDYHTGDRSTGELRDLRAGQCIGACLEYAARKGKPIMIYVFSDGSVFSNGNLDNSQDGRGKGEWTGDNQSTAASFFLVYSPVARPQLLGGTPEQQANHQQIGFMRADASVETASTPAANNVNLLTQTVILNYMALHDDQYQSRFASLFPNHGLGNSTLMDSLTAFAPIVTVT